MGTDMSEERSPNLFFPAPQRTERWKEVGFSKDTYKCGYHNVFMSSEQSFWVSTAIQLQPFFLHLEQVFQNVIMKNIIFTCTVRASHWFTGLNVASTHKNGYVRNAKGLLI